MVKVLDGLKPGPTVVRVFGPETGPRGSVLHPGDEVRCTSGQQEIYIGVLGVSADGWLLGHVVALGESMGTVGLEARIGELVQVCTDRVMAVLHPN